ncbi:MAG: hypothetical protein ABIN00_04305 [candidate division WOR-3 bacterium]
MRKFLFLILFFPVIIFSFKSDTYLFSGDSYERYPYFLFKSKINTIFDFENYTDNCEVFYRKDFVLDYNFYDFQVENIYKKKDGNFLFYEFKNPSSLNYDVNLVSDRFITRIYSSIFKNDSVLFFKGFSNFQIFSGNLYDYNNQMTFNYKFLTGEISLSGIQKSVLSGYTNNLLSTKIGYDFSKKFVSKIFLYAKNFYFYLNERFDPEDKSFQHLLYSKYFGSFYLTNYNVELFYDSSLTFTTGVLQRILPSFSVYGNFEFLYPEKELFLNGGSRFTGKNIYIDFMPFYKNGINPNLSFLYETRFFDFQSMVFRDTILYYNLRAKIKGYFFKNNLELSSTFDYKSSKEFEVFLNFKIVDGSFFMGSKFFLESKEYLLKGGFSWKFLD